MKPIFDKPLLVEHHPTEPRKRVLARSAVYISGLLHQEITIPKGFVTDYASVPRYLWWLYPPVGGYDDAAVVHDYLYECGPEVIPELTRAQDEGDGGELASPHNSLSRCPPRWMALLEQEMEKVSITLLFLSMFLTGCMTMPGMSETRIKRKADGTTIVEHKGADVISLEKLAVNRETGQVELEGLNSAPDETATNAQAVAAQARAQALSGLVDSLAILGQLVNAASPPTAPPVPIENTVTEDPAP